MKKLLTLFVGLVLCAQAFALDTLTATVVSTTVGRYGVAQSLASTGGTIQSITLNNTTNTAIVVGIFSIPGTNLVIATGAYTNHYQYSTNLTTSYTDLLGNTVAATNAVLVTGTQAVATNVFWYPKLLSVTVPASSTYTFTPVTPLPAPNGLGVTNGFAAIEYTVLWNPAQ